MNNLAGTSIVFMRVVSKPAQWLKTHIRQERTRKSKHARIGTSQAAENDPASEKFERLTQSLTPDRWIS
jgi:hypothetical protein